MSEPIPFPPRPRIRPKSPPIEPLPVASDDPLGIIRLAKVHGEHAELARLLSITAAADAADSMADAVAAGPADTFTRAGVVNLLQTLAKIIRQFKDPRGAPSEQRKP